MLGFLKSTVGRMLALAMAVLFIVVGFADSAQARCRCHRKHPVMKFVGRLLLVLFCCGICFSCTVPAIAGHAIVQRQVMRQKVVRQRVVVRQQVVAQHVVAQPVVVQQLYAQPLVQQQLVVPQQFYVPSQQIIQQRVVAPGCQAFFAR